MTTATQAPKSDDKPKTIAEMTGDELEAHIDAKDKAHRESQKHLRAYLRCVRDKEASA